MQSQPTVGSIFFKYEWFKPHLEKAEYKDKAKSLKVYFVNNNDYIFEEVKALLEDTRFEYKDGKNLFKAFIYSKWSDSNEKMEVNYKITRYLI